MNLKALLFGLGLALVLADQTPCAQQSEADDKRLAELHAKAETGDAKAQYELGKCYDFGQGVKKDETEAVKWFVRPLTRTMLGLSTIWASATPMVKA